MKRLKLQTGSNIVEFALVLPLLLVLVFGIVDFSIALYDKAVVTNAVREGARNGIVFADTRPTTAQVEAVVNTYCQNKLISFGTVTTGATATFSPNRAPDPQQSGDTLTVHFQYSYDFAVISWLIPSLGRAKLDATSVMRLE